MTMTILSTRWFDAIFIRKKTENMKRCSQVLIKYPTNENSHLSLTFQGEIEEVRKKGEEKCNVTQTKLHRKNFSFYSFILCSFLFCFFFIREKQNVNIEKGKLFKMHSKRGKKNPEYTNRSNAPTSIPASHRRQEINSWKKSKGWIVNW